jgi:hypothetical protein
MNMAERELNRKIEPRENDLPFYPIGQIQFGEGKSLFISSNDIGSLKSTTTPTEIEASDFAELNVGRVLNLKKYKDVQVVRVQPGHFDIATYPTIDSNRDKLYVRLQYDDATTEIKGAHGMDEIDMLKVLTGEAGGLAVFQGGDSPAEIALVMEKGPDKKEKTAVVAFFQHDGLRDHQLGFDSVSGAYAFFRNLNEEFAENPTELEDEIRKRLDKGFKKKIINESPVRREILKSVLLAHARLYDITADETHLEFINQHLPEGILNRSFENLDTEIEVSGIINTLIIGRSGQSDENNNQEDLNKKRSIELKTDEAKRIYDFYREQLGKNFGVKIEYYTSNLVKELMEGYLREIIFHAKNSTQADSFADLSLMLKELFKTPYASSDRGLTSQVQMKVKELGRLEGYLHTNPSMWDLMRGLINYVDKKHAEALIRDHRSGLYKN